MEEKGYRNIYDIPANYTDSGKWFGGMLEIRNAIETIILVVAIGYLELTVIPMEGMIRVEVMTITLLPLTVISAMGIDGNSLLQYLVHIVLFLIRKRKLHYRRVGYRYGSKQIQSYQKKKFGKA